MSSNKKKAQHDRWEAAGTLLIDNLMLARQAIRRTAPYTEAHDTLDSQLTMMICLLNMGARRDVGSWILTNKRILPAMHKALRSYDVFDTSYLDMALYSFWSLSMSGDFLKIFKKLVKATRLVEPSIW